jgi:putative transposase
LPVSSYYFASHHVGRVLDTEEEIDNVVAAYTENFGSPGRRWIKRILDGKGLRYSEHRIARILRKCGLESKYGRRRTRNVHTSVSCERYIADNIFRRLSPEEKSRLKIWSTDFTEQKIDGQRIFTSGIIDTRTKVLVGRLCADRIESRLAIDTLEQAIAKYGKPDMLLTDRGAQYMSRAFYDTLNGYGIAHSMSRPHKPVDNVYIETFWKTMKTEIGKVGHLCRPDYVMVVEYYADYYNTERLHSSLSYKTPLRYMQEQNVI